MAKLLSSETRTRLSLQALVLAAVAVLAAGLAAFIYYATLPYAGFEFVSHARIGSIVPGSPAEAVGLHVGDQVTAMDGRPPRPGMGYLRPGQDSLRLTVTRDGQSLTLDIALKGPSLRERIYTGSHYLVALALWLIAMVVLLMKPKDLASRMFVLICLLGAMAIATWSLADLGLAWPNMLMSTLVVATGPLFLHFHALFPERSTLKGSRVLVVSAYVVGLTLWLLSTVSDAAYYFQLGAAGDRLPSLAPAIEAFFSICVLVGIGLLIRTYLVTKSGVSRRRVALILLGTGLALVPFILLIAVPQILGIPYPVPTWLTLLLVLSLPLSYLYAILRHKLMGIDRAINRSVVLYLVSLTLFALYIALSLGLRTLDPQLFSGPLPRANLVLIPSLVFLFGPVKQGSQQLVDRVFYGGWYDYETLISRASERLHDTLDMDAIADLLVDEVANTMHLAAAALLLPDREHAMVVRKSVGFAQKASISQRGSLIARLLQISSPISNDTLGERLPPEVTARQEWATWSTAGARLWVPLVQQGELMGLLVLGEKLAGDFFYPRDYRMLTTLAQQAAVALRRVSLVEDLRSQVHEARALARQVLALQEKNQQQMAEEIHARLLQDLAVADLFLDEAQSAYRPEEVQSAREVLQEISRYLRTILFELQPPAWDTSDLKTVLSDYVSNVRKRRQLPVEFRTNGNGDGVDVPSQVRTALYRILQESLNNARKHAQASHVQVVLDLTSQRVRLEVRDDGVGFDVPVSFGPYIDGHHLGLVGMREYAIQVNGRLRMESQSGHGTRIVVEVPLQ